MAELRLNEVAVLKEILEDHTARIVLKAFFAHQSAFHTGRAEAYLTSYEEKSAMEHAFFANAYEQGFSALESFCAEQLKKAQA